MNNIYQEKYTELAQLFESENNDGIVFNMTSSVSMNQIDKNSLFGYKSNPLKDLFESSNPHINQDVKQQNNVFDLSSNSPLKPIHKDHIFNHCIDPTTGVYYDGMYMIGEFASIGVLNNNNRIYVKENYIELIKILRYQIHTIGVYGELEHPKQYATNNNNISHKIVDIWYDESTDKVMGIIVILDTEKGRIAKQIVKSGGQLALSARGGGKEIKNNDGSITALLSLLVSFDIVGNPGFNTARQQYFGDIFDKNNDILLTMYKPSNSEQLFVGNLNESYIQNLNENVQELTQQTQQKGDQQISDNQQQSESQKLQDGDVAEQQRLQDKLQDKVQQTLNQSFNLMQQKMVKPKPNGALLEVPDTGELALGITDNIFQENLKEIDDEFEQFMSEL